ncbi:hypothetical protein JOC83_000946 [Bacillus iocasae]|uniref:Uncharacterized protein n=1 Tax=Priestia iocasae TaxID=2291674 RepID=A0ABS2QRN0_9BACI|nr:hypothetical protein [Metabacillus iocasae]
MNFSMKKNHFIKCIKWIALVHSDTLFYVANYYYSMIKRD